MDETDTPTSLIEHFFIASELTRLGVKLTSLAPRFVGRFEKGVDYIGDVYKFESELKQHMKIIKYFGHYKLSIHSGSDKFSIYPILARNTQNLVHLKTEGTSYLESLRVISQKEPSFFRSILKFCMSAY